MATVTWAVLNEDDVFARVDQEYKDIGNI